MNKLIAWIDRTPVWLFALLVATLGLAPWVPEPHIAEKIRWLFQGELTRPLDIFDLVLHAVPWLLLALKLSREVWLEYAPHRPAPKPAQPPRDE
ncbi:RND transporter [Thioalkalivibrio sp.]|uniref:RND transporter n=1 Tax=Thioalkalivibrio sp. TaxID=2093813 RepID=UPI0035673DCA